MSFKFIVSTVLLFLSFLLFSCSLPQLEYHYPDLLNVGFSILNNPQNYDDWVTLRTRVRNLADQIEIVDEQLKEYDGNHFERFSTSHLLRIYGISYDIPRQCQLLDNYVRNRTVDYVIKEECGKEFLTNASYYVDFRRQINRINEHLNDVIYDYYRLKLNNYTLSPYTLAPNDLYKFVASNCEDYSNTTTCFFHRVAGNNFLQFRAREPFHSTRSIHQEVYLTYLKISTALLKGHASQIFRYIVEYSQAEAAKEVEVSKATFAIHTSHIAKVVHSALKIAPRDIKPSDPPLHIEGKTYIRLKWFAEQFIVNEANLNPTATCSNKCEDYAISTFYEYGNVPSNGSDVCYGVIHSCYHQPLGRLCSAIEPSFRRYEGIKGITNLGNTYACNNASNHTSDLYYVKSGLFNRCDVCTCYCDDHRNPQTVRIFSFRKVTSDIRNNMVITGLRLREIDGIIYIQIQQGQLMKPGVIDRSTVRWAPVERVNTSDPNASPDDFYKLRYLFERSVSLNTVGTNKKFVREYIRKIAFTNNTYTPENIPSIDSYVMTGIKFGSNQFKVNIAARFTAVNMQTGGLILDDSWDGWIINEESPTRDEIKIDKPHIPVFGPEENIEVVGEEMFVKFRPTDNVKDFGQTTVPFLDSQEVISDPPIPLSGAGMFYKGQPGYGGFIALKLISYDFSQFISTELSLR